MTSTSRRTRELRGGTPRSRLEEEEEDDDDDDDGEDEEEGFRNSTISGFQLELNAVPLHTQSRDHQSRDLVI